MPAWNKLDVIRGDTEFDALRDGLMCCAVTYATKRFKEMCRLCLQTGRSCQHEMIERRYRCKSPVCYGQGVVDGCQIADDDDDDDDEEEDDTEECPQCPVVWKVLHCTLHDEYVPYVNKEGHLRGPLPCKIGKAKLSAEMKRFVIKQDEWGYEPRVIRANMMDYFPEPKRGFPSSQQIANALKTPRRKEGTKNSIRAIQAYARDHAYCIDTPSSKQFAFGTRQDADGYPHIGAGDDGDPFFLGIISVDLIDQCLAFMQAGRSVMFHADATFKLSDLGYPVISCGFTDVKRAYQVAALFVVSRRQARDYAQCFSALARLFKEVRGRSIRVDYIMGDAEEAQANAFLSIPEFSRATILMCFFHVLYNVRKKVRHLTKKQRKLVFRYILDMHFSENLLEFKQVKEEALQAWRSHKPLQGFSKYFQQQWLDGRFWRWQAFHTPTGFATTNNPCEVYNSSLKLSSSADVGTCQSSSTSSPNICPSRAPWRPSSPTTL